MLVTCSAFRGITCSKEHSILVGRCVPETPNNAPFLYPPDEWFYHVSLAARPSTGGGKNGPALLREAFVQEYPDFVEREWKYERFACALTYLMDHFDDFDTGRIGVVGQTQGIFKCPLWIAFFRFFAHATEETLHDPLPDPSVFIAVASEHL
jgi:hypothetical protein